MSGEEGGGCFAFLFAVWLFGFSPAPTTYAQCHKFRCAMRSDVRQQHHEQVCQCARMCTVCAVWCCSYAMLFHNYNLNTTVLYKNPLVNQCALALALAWQLTAKKRNNALQQRLSGSEARRAGTQQSGSLAVWSVPLSCQARQPGRAGPAKRTVNYNQSHTKCTLNPINCFCNLLFGFANKSHLVRDPHSAARWAMP